MKNKNLQKILIGVVPTVLIAGTVALESPVNSQGAGAAFELSANPAIKKKETETESRLKKVKPEEASDLLYELAQACFAVKDYPRATHYMVQSLDYEAKVNRPEKHCQTLISLGILNSIQRKNDEAIVRYKQVLAMAEKANLHEFQLMAIDSMGTIALRSEKLDEADSYYKQAFDLGVRNKNLVAQVNALVNQASVERIRNHKQKSLEILERAVSLSANAEQDSTLGNALVNIARVQYDLGNLQASVDTYKKAIEIFKGDLESEKEANACWALAEALFDLQRTGQAQKYYEQALEALKEDPDSDLKIAVLLGLGAAEADLGHSDKSQELHKKAHDMAESTGNKGRQLDAILYLGYDSLLAGYPEAALFRLLEGEKLVGKGGMDSKKRATFLATIGKCYKALGEEETAEQYYTEALGIYDRSGDKTSKALTLTCLAVLALDAHKKSEFETYSKEAKEIFAGLDDKRNSAIMDFNHGQFMLMENNIPEAKKYYEAALAALKGTGDRVSEGIVLRSLGLTEFMSNRPQQAIQYYEQSLQAASDTGSAESMWEYHLGIGKCYKRLGLTDMAVSHLSKAIDMVENERSRFTHDSFKYKTLEQRTHTFDELIDLYLRINRPNEALAVAEKGRARAFLDMLAGRKEGAVETFQAPLASRPDLPSTRPKITSGAPQIAMANEAGTRAVSVLPKNVQIQASTAVSTANAAAPDISEIKSLVQNSKSTVLEYFILPDKIVAWVIDPDGAVHMLPPIMVSKSQLEEKVALAYQSITHHPKNQDEVAALAKRRQENMRELYDLLIKPVEAHLPKNEQDLVTIVPHGAMFMIPFAALMAADNKFLIEKHTLAYSPAIGVMRATQKLELAQENQPDKLLAFGNPITKRIEFLGKLPFSEKEVQNVAALFGAEKSLVKIGQDADKKTFLDLAPNYAEVHLATHGLVDEEHPMQSSLILAPTNTDDGLLTVKDILAMNQLKAKLVVLSACQTGRGKITGDGVLGLSRAFIIAGTPSVLVSQWNVDDLITEYQMKTFYKAYLAKSGKCKSLREAQLATIKLLEGDTSKGTPGTRANPRYWAAFQMIGESI